MTLPSIDEWLSGGDFEFALRLKQGSYENHHWLFAQDLIAVDLFNAIALPERFCLLATHYDGARAGYMYSDRPEWMVMANYVLSPPLSAMPELYDGASRALMIVDKQFNRSELEPLLLGFQDHFAAPEKNANFEKFCQVISTVNPYLYASYQVAEVNAGLFVIAREKALLQNFLNSEAVRSAIDYEHNQVQKYRRALWQALGPECGPDKCSEVDCSRLQTAASKKCFLHQNMESV